MGGVSLLIGYTVILCRIYCDYTVIMPPNKKGVQTRRSSRIKARTVTKVHSIRNLAKKKAVKKNLKHKQESRQKKEVTQEIYYKNEGNRSPSPRPSTSTYKAPVHSKLRTSTPEHTDGMPSIRNKSRRIHVLSESAQVMKSNINHKQKQTAQNPVPEIHKKQQYKGHVCRIHPNPDMEIQPNQARHSIQLNLNPQLQAEIRLLQSRSRNQGVHTKPINLKCTDFTGTPLNQRFTYLG